MKRCITKRINHDEVKVWNELVCKHISLEHEIIECEDKDRLKAIYAELRDLTQEFSIVFKDNIILCKPIELTVEGVKSCVIDEHNDIETIKTIIDILCDIDDKNAVGKIYKRCVMSLPERERTVFSLVNHSDGSTYDREYFECLGDFILDRVPRYDNYSTREVAIMFNMTESKVKQIYDQALEYMVSNIRPVLANIKRIDYSDRTLRQCEDIPERVHNVLKKTLESYGAEESASKKTLSWIVSQDIHSKDFKGLGRVTFLEMDLYFTDKLGLEWKRSKLFKNLSACYNEYEPNQVGYGISNERLKEIVVKAYNGICDRNAQCKGLGCKSCIIRKLGLTEEEYTILFEKL